MARFTKGVSGNPRGRRKGVPTATTLLKRELETCKDDIISKCVSMALNGDRFCLKLCLERLIPIMKSESKPVAISIAQNQPLSMQVLDVFNYATAGIISPDAAKNLTDMLSAAARIREIDEIEKRVAELEERMIKDKYDDD